MAGAGWRWRSWLLPSCSLPTWPSWRPDARRLWLFRCCCFCSARNGSAPGERSHWRSAACCLRSRSGPRHHICAGGRSACSTRCSATTARMPKRRPAIAWNSGKNRSGSWPRRRCSAMAPVPYQPCSAAPRAMTAASGRQSPAILTIRRWRSRSSSACSAPSCCMRCGSRTSSCSAAAGCAAGSARRWSSRASSARCFSPICSIFPPVGSTPSASECSAEWSMRAGHRGPLAGPKLDGFTHDTRGLYRIAPAGSCEAGQAPVPGGGVMFRLPRFTSRKALIIAHDLLATVAALLASFYIRFEGPGLAARLDALLSVLPGFVAYAGVVYFIFRLYEGKWRFASLPDLFNIFRAVTVLALSLLVLDYILISPDFLGTFFFGKITIALYWCLQMLFLGGPRITYRYFRYARTRQHATRADSMPILLLGRAADAEVLIRAVESGAVKKIWPIGVLSPSEADQAQAIRGIPVLGRLTELEQIVAELQGRGQRVTRLVLTASALVPEAKPETILLEARRLGLTTSRLPSLEGVNDAEGQTVRLAPIMVEDLLLRPSAKIDYQRLETVVRGRAVVVTGGGGSIGSEICDRVVTFGAARLLILDTQEP